MTRRWGRVALVGRPNAGKSTLVNLLLGEKLAIVSEKPQTTRHRLMGILTEERGQMVLLDTPGVHKARHRMNRRMVREARAALDEADVICLIVDVAVELGAGDAFMTDLIAKTRVPRLVALNKIDLVQKPLLLPIMARYDESGLFEEIVPVSARTGDGTSRILDLLWDRLPPGDPVYDPDLLTLHPERFLVSERIREKLLARTRDELPFSTAVRIDDWAEEPEGGRISILGTILVEKESQKGIVVGRGGSKIREISMAARADLEEFLERDVFLRLYVRCEPGWRENKTILQELDREVWSRLSSESEKEC